METKFTFFWDGPLSQWSRSPFMDIEGIVYCTAEQYMMAQKAFLFKDQETFAKIMATTNPKEQKALGRQVKNFNQQIWDVYSTLIVCNGNILKFSQNKKHLDLLIKTAGTILVEVNPSDCIWGIGMSEDNPERFYMSQWRGENRLGFILTHVRDLIITELANQDGIK